jgi:hypothetical protein
VLEKARVPPGIVEVQRPGIMGPSFAFARNESESESGERFGSLSD